MIEDRVYAARSILVVGAHAFDAEVIARFMARTGRPEDVVRGWFEPGRDMHVSAEAAVELGMADEILADVPSGA